MKLPTIILLASVATFSAIGDESRPAGDPNAPPDPQKVSYALGMNLGLQIKRIGADVDVNVIAQAAKDVLAGKPTKLEESQLRPLFEQEEAYQVAKRRADGEAFLASNAKSPDVKVLADGLQYKVVEAGSGDVPKHDDTLVISFRGTWIDGTEFRRHEHVQVMPMNCPKGMQEALEQMKPGAKWRIFVPSDLGYGHTARRSAGIGSTLIYDLELISIGPDPAHPGEIYNAGRMGHSPVEVFLPSYTGDQPQNANRSAQNRAAPEVIPATGPEK
jgi:FKBP-type peptidyl-prolyl cis-trans isomerase FklB